MPSCDVCNKSITNRSPGIRCSKCGKIVHANQTCAGLPAKQLIALKNAPNIDWVCGECSRSSPRRKSYIIPEDDGEEDDAGTDNQLRQTKSLLQDLTKELHNTFKSELANVNDSIKRFGVKLDDYEKILEVINNKLITLEKKNIYLTNKNNNLETRITRLEEHIHNLEQNSLNSKLEIVGIPQRENENLTEISNSIAEKLRVDHANIKCTRRLPSRKDKDGPLLVELNSMADVQKWIIASRGQTTFTRSIVTKHTPAKDSEQIIIRRALTRTNKTLLWVAKQKLKPFFKYVWFQNGRVLARKQDSDKPIVIRREDDIHKYQ